MLGGERQRRTEVRRDPRVHAARTVRVAAARARTAGEDGDSVARHGPVLSEGPRSEAGQGRGIHRGFAGGTSRNIIVAEFARRQAPGLRRDVLRPVSHGGAANAGAAADEIEIEHARVSRPAADRRTLRNQSVREDL